MCSILFNCILKHLTQFRRRNGRTVKSSLLCTAFIINLALFTFVAYVAVALIVLIALECAVTFSFSCLCMVARLVFMYIPGSMSHCLSTLLRRDMWSLTGWLFSPCEREPDRNRRRHRTHGNGRPKPAHSQPAPWREEFSTLFLARACQAAAARGPKSQAIT